MECKGLIPIVRKTAHIVLIETLWNVKLEHLWQSDFVFPVLIETLWNVKEECVIPLAQSPILY